MPVPLDSLPDHAASACRAARDSILDILGADLVGLWLHGGTTFPDRPRRPGDLDLGAALARVAPEERDLSAWKDDRHSRPYRLSAALAELSRETGLAVDATFLLADEMAGAGPVAEAFWPERVRVGWAVERAHWVAGQFVVLHGRGPDGMVTAPTWEELEAALDREVEHLERHVYEGDAADPYEATYAMFNGCRILHTLRTGSPVISKRSAGRWGLEHLEPRWHPALVAADRSYDGRADAGDEKVLEATVPAFVEMVRTELPVTTRRPPGPPRWS